MSVVLEGLVAAAAAGGATAGSVAGRRRLVRRAQRGRVRVIAVPGPLFDPSVDQLRAWVGAAGRARSWQLPARIQTIRCEFSMSGGHLVVAYEMPSRMLRAARFALPAGLQLVDVQFARRFKTMDSEAARHGPVLGPGTARCEFVIAAARGHRLPPAPAELDLTHAMGELARRCGSHEAVTLMVDIAPLSRRAVKRFREELVDESRPASTRQLRGGQPRHRGRARSSSGDLVGQVVDDVQDLLTGGAGVGAGSDVRQGDVALHRHAGSAVTRALADPRPVYLQMLAVARSDKGRERAGMLLSQLHATIAPLGSPGEADIVKRTGRRYVARRLRSEDGPFLRPGFDARVRSGWMSRRAAVCSLEEVAPLMRAPTRHATSDAIARTVVIPAPKSMPKWRRQKGVLPMGMTVDHDGNRQVVGMALSEYKFGLSSGRAGFGKTVQMLVQALHLALVEKSGIFLLDPQCDAISDMVSYLGAERERVVVVDLTLESHDARHVQWNPLSMAGLGQQHLAARTDAMTDAIALAARWGNAPRSKVLVRQLMRTMLYLAYALPAEAAPTLPIAHQFIVDEDLRALCVKRLPDPLARWWVDTYPKFEAQGSAPLDNTFAGLMGADGVRAVLGRPESTYNARRAVRERQIVLASAGDAITNNLSTLLLNDIMDAIRASKEVADKDQRQLMWMLLDEAQLYDDGELIPLAFRMLRKFGGRSMVLTQSPGSLHANTIDAIAVNGSYLSTTAQSREGATWFGKQWGSEEINGVERALQKWENYRYLTQPTSGGRRTAPFTIEGLSLDAAWRDQKATPEQLEEIWSDIRKRTAPHTIGETLKFIDGHAATIASALGGQAGKQMPDPPADFLPGDEDDEGITYV